MCEVGCCRRSEVRIRCNIKTVPCTVWQAHLCINPACFDCVSSPRPCSIFYVVSSLPPPGRHRAFPHAPGPGNLSTPPFPYKPSTIFWSSSCVYLGMSSIDPGTVPRSRRECPSLRDSIPPSPPSDHGTVSRSYSSSSPEEYPYSFSASHS